jgi:hypothetical protein
MDKFGTIYVSIFAHKLIKDATKNKFAIPDKIIKELISIMGNDYHYSSMSIKNQILFHPGL